MSDRQALLAKTKEGLVEIILNLEQRMETLEAIINGKPKDPPPFINSSKGSLMTLLI